MAEEVQTENAELEAKKKQILELTSTKHVKVWLLHETCLLKNKEIAEILDTNQGAVGNALKMYSLQPEKMDVARAFLK